MDIFFIYLDVDRIAGSCGNFTFKFLGRSSCVILYIPTVFEGSDFSALSPVTLAII